MIVHSNTPHQTAARFLGQHLLLVRRQEWLVVNVITLLPDISNFKTTFEAVSAEAILAQPFRQAIGTCQPHMES